VTTPQTGQAVVYYARAVDGLTLDEVIAAGGEVRDDLSAHGITILDPVASSRIALDPETVISDPRALVEHDLNLLRRSDAVLMEMDIPDRNYVGCCFELAFAAQWNIPCVVNVGRTDNGSRVWLRAHAHEIVESYGAAVQAIVRLTIRRETMESN